MKRTKLFLTSILILVAVFCFSGKAQSATDYSNSWVFVITYEKDPLPASTVDFICNSVKPSVDSFIRSQSEKYNQNKPFNNIICIQEQVLLPFESFDVNSNAVIEFLENKISFLSSAKYVTIIDYMDAPRQFYNYNYLYKYVFVHIESPMPGIFYPSLTIDEYAETISHEFMHGLRAIDKYGFDSINKSCCLIDPLTSNPYSSNDIMCHSTFGEGSGGGGCNMVPFNDLIVSEPTAKEIEWIPTPGLVVSLDKSSPVSQNILYNQTGINLAAFKFTNTREDDIKIGQINFKRIGTSSDAALERVHLFLNGIELTSGTIASENKVYLNNLSIIIPSHAFITVKVQADLNGIIGTTVGLAIDSPVDVLSIINNCCLAYVSIPPRGINGNLMTLVKPSITVTSPNGGENWRKGSYQIIKWTPSNLKNTDKIYVSVVNASGNKSTTIASGLSSATKSFIWKVPSAATSIPAGQYKVNIWTVENQKTISDKSDNFFNITSTTTAGNVLEDQLASIADALANIAQQIQILFGH